MYNILDHIGSTATKSTSSENAGKDMPLSVSKLISENPGFCPKCGQAFGPAKANCGGQFVDVYYCENCRVSEPTPDNSF